MGTAESSVPLSWQDALLSSWVVTVVVSREAEGREEEKEKKTPARPITGANAGTRPGNPLLPAYLHATAGGFCWRPRAGGDGPRGPKTLPDRKMRGPRWNERQSLRACRHARGGGALGGGGGLGCQRSTEQSAVSRRA